MGTSLTGVNISASYLGLLKSTDSLAIGGTKKIITDGAGNNLPFGISTSSFTFNAGAEDVPALSIGTINEGFYQPTDETLGVTINGSEVARFNSTGLGIGVSPASGFKLTTSDQSWIKGGLLVGGSNGVRTSGSTLVIDGGGSSSVNLRFILNSTGYATSDGGQIIFSNTGALSLRSMESGGSNYGINLQQKGGSTILFAEATNKNVGINTLTPSSKLTISGGDILLDNSNKLLWGNTSDVYIAGTTSADNIQLGVGGSTQFTFAQITGMRLHQYGSGNITGTVTQRLGVTSTGQVVEIPIGAGALDGSGTAGKIAKFTDSDTLGDSIMTESSGAITINLASNPTSLQIGSSLAEDPFLVFETDGNTMAMGIDRSDSNKFKISDNSGTKPLGTNDRLIIDTSGNVGISTTSPNHLLDVESVGASMRLYNTTSNGNTEFFITTAGTTGASKIMFGDTDDADIGKIIYRHNGNSMAFETNDSESMRIDSNGNVGIGTTSPTARLDIITNSASGTNSIDRNVRFRADNGEQRFNFTVGRSGNSSFLDMYDSDESLNLRLASDGNSYFNGGNVGIGTSSPLAKLHTSDNDGGTIYIEDANATSTYSITSFTNGAGNFSLDTRTSAGSFVATEYQISKNASGADYHRWFTQGTEKVRLDSNGTLLVGTTSAQSGTKFQVNGVSYFQGVNTTNGTAVFVPDSNKGTAQSHIHYGSTGDWFIRPSSNSGKVVIADNTSMKVAIGNSSPVAKLDVVSGTNNNAVATDFRFVASNRAITTERANFEIFTNDNQATDIGASLGFGGRHTDSSTNASLFATIKAGKSNSTSGNFQGYFQIGTSDSGSDISERFRIDSSGATFAGHISLNDSGQLQLGTGNDSQIYHNGLHLFIDNSTGNSYLRNTSTSGIIIRNSNGGDIQFDNEFAGNILFNTSNIERVRLDSSGRVGIATTSPSEQLEVVGNIYANVSNTGGFMLTSSSASGLVRNNATGVALRTNTTDRLVVDSSGNVGIGTSTISQALHQHVDSSGSNYHAFTNNSTGTGGSDGFLVGINADESALVWNQENTELIFATNNTERARITSNGFVGIGTTSIDRPLHVESNNDSPIQVESTDDTTGIMFKDNNSSNALFYRGTGNYFYTSSRFNVGDIGATASSTALGVSATSFNSGNTNGQGEDEFLALFQAGTNNVYNQRYIKIAQTFTGSAKKSPIVVFEANNDSDNHKSYGTIGVDTDGSFQFSNIADQSSAIAPGTEIPVVQRMKIDSTGRVIVNDDANIQGTTFSAGFLRFNSSGKVRLSANNNVSLGFAETLNITNTQLVGIGTTAPNSYNSAGNHLVIAGTGNTGLTIAGGTSNDSNIFFADGTSGADAYRGILRYQHSDNSMLFFTNATERMRIHSNGNVGIGETSPNDTLHVQGDVKIVSGVQKTPLFEVSSFIGGHTGDVAYIHCATPSSTGYNLLHVQGDSDDTPIEALVVRGDGKVGIGTTSPSANLEVSKGSEGDYLIIGGDNASNTRALKFTSSTATSNGALHTIDAQSSNGVIALATGGSERARFTDDGGFRVGTTARIATSNVIFNQVTGADWGLNINSATTTSTHPFGLLINYSDVSPNNTTQDFIRANDSTTTRFKVMSNGGIANYQSNDSNLSDKRVKKDIVDAPSSLNEICQFKVRNYKYKDQEDSKVHTGLIAQEVEKIDSNLIDNSGWGEDNYKAIYNTDVMFKMLKAIQEQQDIIKKLEARVEELEKEI